MGTVLSPKKEWQQTIPGYRLRPHMPKGLIPVTSPIVATQHVSYL